MKSKKQLRLIKGQNGAAELVRSSLTQLSVAAHSNNPANISQTQPGSLFGLSPSLEATQHVTRSRLIANAVSRENHQTCYHGL